MATLAWLLPGGTNATTIGGVEFLSWKTISAPAGVDLTLDTLGDLYLFIPNGLFTDQATFVAENMIVFEGGITLDQNDPLLCDPSCDLVEFTEDGDVALHIYDPLGNVSLSARNIVVSRDLIPEPGALPLLALGLIGLSRWRPRDRCPKNSVGAPHGRSALASARDMLAPLLSRQDHN